MQAILAQNIGEYVVIEFLIGTENIVRKQGMLYFVGRSFVTLLVHLILRKQGSNPKQPKKKRKPA